MWLIWTANEMDTVFSLSHYIWEMSCTKISELSSWPYVIIYFMYTPLVGTTCISLVSRPWKVISRTAWAPGLNLHDTSFPTNHPTSHTSSCKACVCCLFGGMLFCPVRAQLLINLLQPSVPAKDFKSCQNIPRSCFWQRSSLLYCFKHIYE